MTTQFGPATAIHPASPAAGVGLEAEAPQAVDAAVDTFKPKIIAFLCRWCSYAGADLAGSSRTKYPADIRIIRVPCSCRVDPNLVIKCLQQGVDGVLVSGCHPGDCHYTSGNYNARRRMLMLKELLVFVGLDPRRVQMSWVSASEGGKWAQVVADVTKEIKALGSNGHAGGHGAARP
jgi:F420-non-reducing hydrogenase iron-sulfur subunit